MGVQGAQALGSPSLLPRPPAGTQMEAGSLGMALVSPATQAVRRAANIQLAVITTSNPNLCQVNPARSSLRASVKTVKPQRGPLSEQTPSRQPCPCSPSLAALGKS